VSGAIQLCKATDTPIARMIEKGIERIGRPLSDVHSSIENVANLEVSKLENGLPLLATTAGGAPMIGFLGTVIGMVMAFDDIQAAGDISPTVVAGGMKVALITTIFGIVAALILQVFYNYILTKIEALTAAMEESSISLLDMILKYNLKYKK
jgi:biopolymer transport protein ExbB